MSDKYPKIGRTRDMRQKWVHKNRKGEVVCNANRPRCVACSQPADYRVDVEVNWFRGDDLVVNSCTAHRKDATALSKGQQP